MYRIALPKGALMEGSKKLLQGLGLDYDDQQKRKLIMPTFNGQAEVLIVRPTDVAVYVENGAADLGFVGSDVIEEHSPKVLTLAALPYGRCDLVLATPTISLIKDLASVPDYCKVATKFPNLTRRFFRQHGIPVEIIKLYGSIEIAPLLKLSEAIVDLVGTGRTLRENGLHSIHHISTHTSRLIANRVSWQLNHSWIKKLIDGIDEQTRGEESKT
ncbi:MAG: ATP phosphoribosyltransferase [Candidatus Caenarcaniphilales bacterium]|nr:ATP phosphoribosyltransferase [Candidatus Caenarcaniphilales bacterium]